MKKTTLLLLTTWLILFFSCSNETNIPYLKFTDQDYEYFTFPCNKDTILVNSKGVKINIDKNTFSCNENNSIQIKTASVLDKIDMIKHHMFSLDKNGKILESGGMFYLDIVNSEIQLNQDIRIEIPSNYLNSEMTKFILEENSDQYFWVDTKEKIEGNNFEAITEGEKLFNNNCATCHAKDLVSDLTGPALGNIYLYRDKEWLFEFTRNSQKMIAEGDILASCLWNKWSPTAMNNFKDFSDTDLENIYLYIENESKRTGIGKNDVKYIQKCNLDSINRVHRNRLKVQNENMSIYTILIDKKNRWYNIDYLFNYPYLVDPITVHLEEATQNPVYIYLYFENRNIVVPFVPSDDNKYILMSFQENEKINLPLNEEVYIIALKGNPITHYQKEKHIIQKDNNQITLKFKPLEGDDFYKLIK